MTRQAQAKTNKRRAMQATTDAMLKESKHTQKQISSASTTKRAQPRTQPPNENAKTVLCHSFEKDGKCRYGNRCNYAHGISELKQRKQNKPCWFFNSGGCEKSDEACVYQHTLVDNLRKPLHLQHPCWFFHNRTPGKCNRGESCGGDHDYELTEEEWKHHFKGIYFPGKGYLAPEPEPEEPESINLDEFPALPHQPALVLAQAKWGPLESESPSNELGTNLLTELLEMCTAPQQDEQDRCSATLAETEVATDEEESREDESEISGESFLEEEERLKTRLGSGSLWSEMIDEEEEEQRREEEKRKEEEEEKQRQAKIVQIDNMLAKLTQPSSDGSKVPPMDAETQTLFIKGIFQLMSEKERLAYATAKA